MMTMMTTSRSESTNLVNFFKYLPLNFIKFYKVLYIIFIIYFTKIGMQLNLKIKENRNDKYDQQTYELSVVLVS